MCKPGCSVADWQKKSNCLTFEYCGTGTWRNWYTRTLQERVDYILGGSNPLVPTNFMRIVVTVKPRAKQEKLERQDEGHYTVWVTAAPEGGKANQAVIAVLADQFKVAKSRIRIVMGKTHREKLIETDD